MNVSNRRYVINTTGPITEASLFWCAYAAAFVAGLGVLLAVHVLA